MDKKKVTIIIVALAVVLVLYLLYRYGMDQLETQKKIKDADADLQIKKANDEYLAEKEDEYRNRKVIALTEGSYEAALQQTTLADGYETLVEYRNSLTEGEKVEYDADRSTYIEVMGKDPGLMSLEQLRKWYSDYSKWDYLNDQYIELTGESKSFLDPEFDTAAEMKAAINSAKAAIEIAQKEADDEWNEAYIQLQLGTDDLVGRPLFDKAELKNYCPTTSDLAAFHAHLSALYLEWETNDKAKLQNYMSATLYPAIVDDLTWTSNSHNNVSKINCFQEGICNYLTGLDVRDQLYLMSLYNNPEFPQFKAVSQYTRVNTTRDPHDPKKLYSMTDAMRNRLTVSDIEFYPTNAKSIGDVKSFSIVKKWPTNYGSERSDLVTKSAPNWTANKNATNLLGMILSLEAAARDYEMTSYGFAIRKGEYNHSILVDWATRIDNLN